MSIDINLLYEYDELNIWITVLVITVEYASDTKHRDWFIIFGEVVVVVVNTIKAIGSMMHYLNNNNFSNVVVTFENIFNLYAMAVRFLLSLDENRNLFLS